MKLFVWDFHGTLEKDNEIAVGEISNEALKRLDYSERFTVEDDRKLYGKKWFEYFEYILPHESHEKHLELQAASFEISNNSPELVARHIKPNDHAHHVLKTIAESKHGQILLSNTRPESLSMFMESIGISEFFPNGFAFAADAHTKDITKSKQDILNKFLEGKSYKEIIVIGDSGKDVSLVEVAGGKSYLYAHPGTPFRQADAHHKITDLREILREI